MIVIPAIDLLDGKAVRLERGAADRVTVYDGDPVGLARRFVKQGARRIHVVDLEGAFAGGRRHAQLVAAIAEAVHDEGGSVQVGGGLRDAAAVDGLIDAGADFVVLGTIAVRDPEAAATLCRRLPGRVIVAADARDGQVAVAGWTEESSQTAEALARAAEAWGAAAILHTDVDRDGMRTGPAIEATTALQRAVSIPIYASGGVGTLADLSACAAAGIRGVVVGRALYEGAFTLQEALDPC